MRILAAVCNLQERARLRQQLRLLERPVRLTTVTTAAEFRARLATGRFDLAILQRRLPDGLAEAVLPTLPTPPARPPVIVVSVDRRDDTVLACMRAGAADYLLFEQAAETAVLRARVGAVLRQAHRLAAWHTAQTQASVLSLAGRIAEELNQGLAGILGRTTLLRRLLRERSPEANCAESIFQMAERLALQTRQLQAYAGGTRRRRATARANRLIKAVLAAMDESLRRGVRIQTDLARGLWRVAAGAEQLGLIVRAVLSNALEAVGGAGTVTIGTENVVNPRRSPAQADDDAPAGEFVRICILDTGAGMSLAVQRRMFEPYFSTKGAGRGLGLAAVAGLVEQLGGFLTVETAPECGTQVDLYLPRAAAPRRRIAGPPGRDRASRRGVLIVDDDAAVREVLAEVFEALEYRVAQAADGLQAVEMFAAKAEQIDLVVLDLRLPALNGVAVFDALRSVRSDIPIVICTGAANDPAARRLLENREVAGFLAKPFTPAALLRQVDALLTRA